MDVNKIIIEYLKLIIDLLHYAGWPILIFIIFMYYRKKIPLLVGDLLSRVKKVSFNKASIEFAQEVEGLKKYQLNENSRELSKSIEYFEYLSNSKFKYFINIQPAVAILFSWQDIEIKLHQIGIEPNEIRKLKDKLTIDQVKLISTLNDLRNKIVHDVNKKEITITKELALEYRQSCFEVLQILNNIDDNVKN